MCNREWNVQRQVLKEMEGWMIRVLVVPPIGLAAAVPVASQRRRQFTTVDTLTA